VKRSSFRCLAACRRRSSAWVTRSRFSARCVSCWPAFPSAPALRSSASAPGRPGLFGELDATMTGPDFSPPFIIGDGSSPSRCGPAWPQPPGQKRDLPGSDGLLLCVMRSSTPARRRRLAWRRRTCCLRCIQPAWPSRCTQFRGSMSHPTQLLCTLRLRRRRRRRNTRYQAGATPYLGRTSTGWIPPALPGALDTRNKSGHDGGGFGAAIHCRVLRAPGREGAERSPAAVTRSRAAAITTR
jgi:hypothetical protein